MPDPPLTADTPPVDLAGRMRRLPPPGALLRVRAWHTTWARQPDRRAIWRAGLWNVMIGWLPAAATLLADPELGGVVDILVAMAVFLPVIAANCQLMLAAFDAGPFWRRFAFAIPLACLTVSASVVLLDRVEEESKFLVLAAPLAALLFWTVAWLSSYRLRRVRERTDRRRAGIADMLLITTLAAIATAFAMRHVTADVVGADPGATVLAFTVLAGLALLVAGGQLALALAVLAPVRFRGLSVAAAVLVLLLPVAVVCVGLATDGFQRFPPMLRDVLTGVAVGVGHCAVIFLPTVVTIVVLWSGGVRLARVTRRY